MRHSVISLCFLASVLAACGEAAAPPTATKLAFKTSPATVSSGSTLADLTVEVQDPSGTIFTAGEHQITLSLDNANGAELSGTTTALTTNGVATFTNLKILKAGSGYSIRATASGLTEATSPTFSITPGFITRLAFQVEPSSVAAGVSMAPGVVVAAYDANDNLATTSTISMSLSLSENPGGAILTGAQATLANGVATFPSLSLNKVGAGYVLTASTTAGVTAASSAFDVTPGAAAALAITSFPAAIIAGETLTPVIVVVRDQFGNTVTNSSASITLSGASSGFAFAGLPVLNGTTTLTAVSGVATFSNVSFDRYGGVAIRASAPGLTAASTPVGVSINLVSLDADSTHACGLTSTSTAFCWGNVAVGDGSTGIKSSPQLVSGGQSYKAIATGAEHTCALTTAGAAYCWGNGGNSQIGDGSAINRLTPVPVSSAASFTAIAAGWWHSCGITTTGSTLCWGYNQNAQLGDGSTTDRNTPVVVSGGLTFAKIAAGRYHTCALTAAGQAYCWGSNEHGQVGDNGPGSNRTAPVAVAGGLTFASISANGNGTCALTAAGVAYCWGLNDVGQVGDGSEINRAVPTPVSGGLTFKSISTSGNHVCAVSSIDAMWCWGSNAQAQSENGAPGKTSVPLRVGSEGEWTFSVVAVGDRNTFAIGRNTIFPDAPVRAYSWGLNTVGQLGKNSLVATLSIGQFVTR